MFTSSFGTNTIQQSATPYSTQQQIVEVEMPEPAKSFLRFGGASVAVLGTSSLVFWELASKKHRTKPQLLLAAVPRTIDNIAQPLCRCGFRVVKKLIFSWWPHRHKPKFWVFYRHFV